ncbi:hypothetical protein K3Z84_12335 [Pseudomonas aeruginosa]|nr:hypothetical protein [Pseudomonas aeruginosa]
MTGRIIVADDHPLFREGMLAAGRSAPRRESRRYGTESLVDGGVRHLKKGAKARSW